MVGGLIISCDRPSRSACGRAASQPPRRRCASRRRAGGGRHVRRLRQGRSAQAQRPSRRRQRRSAPTPEGAHRRADDGAWVLVTLSPGGWDRLAKDKPARVAAACHARQVANGASSAQPSGMRAGRGLEALDVDGSTTCVPGKDHGLALEQAHARRAASSAGSEDKQKVVPYSAVYYDAKGDAWVYVNTEPLTYERQRIDGGAHRGRSGGAVRRPGRRAPRWSPSARRCCTAPKSSANRRKPLANTQGTRED